MIYVMLFILLLICGVAWQKRKRADKVGAGLQIFNADGKLTLDTMDKSTFILVLWDAWGFFCLFVCLFAF